MKFFSTVLVVFFVTTASAAIRSNEISLNDLKNSLPEGITLPPELDGIKLPTGDDILKVLKEKCANESGSDAAYEQATKAAENLMTCVTDLVNFTALPDEIEQAKPNGNLDTVFNKYCEKRNQGLECVETFTNAIDPCLSQEEREQKLVFVNITKGLLEFVCHENGNQIALFIAEEGPECFSDKSDQLQKCAEDVFRKYSNMTETTFDSIPTLVMTKENCEDMDKFEICAVKHLESCKESTPANLFEALFRYVRKETPCKAFRKWSENPEPVTEKSWFNKWFG